MRRFPCMMMRVTTNPTPMMIDETGSMVSNVAKELKNERRNFLLQRKFLEMAELCEDI